MNDIEKLSFWNEHILPASFDESISYVEVLCKLVTKINEVIAEENTTETILYNFIVSTNAALELCITHSELDVILSDYVLLSQLASVATSGDYNDLSNKPTIPTKTSDLTNDSGFIDKNVNDLINYTLSSNLASVATTGDYNDLIDKPTIPTKTSDLTNDSGFIDKNVNDLINYTLSSNLASVATTGDYNDLIDKPTIPTKTTDLTNDNGFIDNAFSSVTVENVVIPSSGEDNLSIIAGSNITLTPNLTDKSISIASIGGSGGSSNYNDLTNKPSINNIELIGNKSTSDLGIVIPTKTSDITNDSGFVDKNVNDLINYTLSSNLASVATTGDYNDLTNKLTANNDIQIVNNVVGHSTSITGSSDIKPRFFNIDNFGHIGSYMNFIDYIKEEITGTTLRNLTSLRHIKLNNGLTICFGSKEFEFPSSGWTAWGGVFANQSLDTTVSYGVTFKEIPIEFIFYGRATVPDFWICTHGSGNSTTTSGRVQLLRGTTYSTSGRVFYLYYLAIGLV